MVGDWASVTEAAGEVSECCVEDEIEAVAVQQAAVADCLIADKLVHAAAVVDFEESLSMLLLLLTWRNVDFAEFAAPMEQTLYLLLEFQVVFERMLDSSP